MASELSQLIESELRKAEGANKPDEHQRRLTSLRVKVRSHLCAPGRCAIPCLCFCWLHSDFVKYLCWLRLQFAFKPNPLR